MHIYDMTEEAYKNGYEAGVKSQQAEIERLQEKVRAEKRRADFREALDNGTILAAKIDAQNVHTKYVLDMVKQKIYYSREPLTKSDIDELEAFLLIKTGGK